jgi:hypothetical protein
MQVCSFLPCSGTFPSTIATSWNAFDRWRRSYARPHLCAALVAALLVAAAVHNAQAFSTSGTALASPAGVLRCPVSAPSRCHNVLVGRRGRNEAHLPAFAMSFTEPLQPAAEARLLELVAATKSRGQKASAEQLQGILEAIEQLETAGGVPDPARSPMIQVRRAPGFPGDPPARPPACPPTAAPPARRARGSCSTPASPSSTSGTRSVRPAPAPPLQTHTPPRRRRRRVRARRGAQARGSTVPSPASRASSRRCSDRGAARRGSWQRRRARLRSSAA